MCALTHFWRLYLLASVVSSLSSMLLFRVVLHLWGSSFEDAAVCSGLFAMPINWLVGEQLTWHRVGVNRLIRAARYFSVYGMGLVIVIVVVHVLSHVVHWPAHQSEDVGVLASVFVTAPLNRFWTWSHGERLFRVSVR